MMRTVLAITVAALTTASIAAEDLPVNQSALEKLVERSGGKSGLTNLLSLEQVSRAIRGGTKDGLSIDFGHVRELLDGTSIDSATIYGTAYYGPYPFESGETRFTYRRFRKSATIDKGAGTLYLNSFFEVPYNSEGWTDRGQIVVRFVLELQSSEKDRKLGVQDITVAFAKEGDSYSLRPALLEGPFVNLVTSDAPDSAVIAYRTDTELKTRVVFRQKRDGAAERIVREEVPGRRHEVRIGGLRPGTTYVYRVEGDGLRTRDFELRAAPAPGSASVRLAYLGDTRAGVGAGLESFMGVNFSTLQRLAHIAFEKDAGCLLVGGDLVNGYTSVRADFEAQLHAWKQAVTGFWHERPVYAAMGNHEALLKAYDDVSVDLWPYETDSAEAVFRDIFVHPRNGPEPSDPRRPTYSENVYSLQYGPVRAIAFNNNYWFSSAASKYGGCPEGYLLDDQLAWIEAELDKAEKDATVRYVLLFAQEPVFPNGGHVGDSMWHRGDNRVRAYTYRDGKLLPEEHGMVAVRNRFVRMVAKRSKVAAVLGADEHAYHRVLIGRDVPIGDIDKDDRNKNARIDPEVGETISRLPDLRFSTWYIVSGGGGAPYYAEDDTPWNEYWRSDPRPLKSGVVGFRYSSQENVVVFDANARSIAVSVYNRHGELVDRIPDLMLDKR